MLRPAYDTVRLRRVLPLLVVLAGMVISACGPGGGAPSGGGGSTSAGGALFQATCASCHGADLRGTEKGPPFLDPTYAPNHHGDAAFLSAVRQGVRPHHWNFGPMPPVQPVLSDQEVADIVAYVRQEQARAGVKRDPSHP